MSTTPEPTTPEPAALEITAPEPAALEIPAPEPAALEPAPPLGDLVAAHFQRLEIAMLSRILTTTLAGALPPSMVRVERRRNLAQRLTGRPGHAIGVSITADDVTLTFRAPQVGLTEATVSHRVRGVVLSSTRITVSEWLDQLADLLNKTTNDDVATRTALERVLT